MPVVDNAKALAATLEAGGCAIVTGGTDNHLMLVDLRPKGLTGKAAEAALGPRPHHLQQERRALRHGEARWSRRASGWARRRRPRAASASPNSGTVGKLIVEVLDGLAKNGDAGNAAVEASVRERVGALTQRFPIY